MPIRLDARIKDSISGVTDVSITTTIEISGANGKWQVFVDAVPQFDDAITQKILSEVRAWHMSDRACVLDRSGGSYG